MYNGSSEDMWRSVVGNVFDTDKNIVCGNMTFNIDNKGHVNKDGDIIYLFDVLGFGKKDLDITTVDDTLYIKGSRDVGEYDSYRKKIDESFYMGDSIESVHAKVENGLLTLTLKKPEKKKTSITIE